MRCRPDLEWCRSAGLQLKRSRGEDRRARVDEHLLLVSDDSVYFIDPAIPGGPDLEAYILAWTWPLIIMLSINSVLGVGANDPNSGALRAII